MRVVRHLSVVVMTGLVGACTWNTYDGHLSGAGAGVLVDPNVGGIAVSSDGLFEIQIPPNGINVAARVMISQSQPGPAGESFLWAYSVSLVAANSGPTAQLWQHASVVVFHLGASGFNMPIHEIFIVDHQVALPGGSHGSDIFAVQAADTSNSTLGPFVIRHYPSQPTENACGPGMDVCSSCFRGCSTNTHSPNPGNDGFVTRACYCVQATSPECMRACVDRGQGNQCK